MSFHYYFYYSPLGVIRVVPDSIKRILNPWIPDSKKFARKLNEENELSGINTRNSLRGDINKKQPDAGSDFDLGLGSDSNFNFNYADTELSVSATLPPWGIDRLNQKNLPLDGKYSSNYTGKDIDVYIIDTGLDTNHAAFKPIKGEHLRTVKNIYNYYGKSPVNPGSDTDGEGHGTHVAGTIGGFKVGVSPHVNIFALKVLSDTGEGSTSAILTSFDIVLTTVKKSGKRSIVSLSLGGPCETANCEKDSLVIGVTKLTSNNIIVSVAAGNEGCNACQGSPNSAPSAINVGATDFNDNVAYFSDIGSCIDIFAPGYNILSACAKKKCGNEFEYVELSGTSMACPHVSGVLAQLLEKNPSATATTITHALSCDASKNILHMDKRDSISRNLMLQVPNVIDGFGTCDLGYGCLLDCSGSGMCLPLRIDPIISSPSISPTTSSSISFPSSSPSSSYPSSPSSPSSSPLSPLSSSLTTNSYKSLQYHDAFLLANATPSNTKYCHCDTGTYGPSCSLTQQPMCISNSIKLHFYMQDSFGDGWTFSKFALTNTETGMIVDGAFDSMCAGASDTREYCVLPGMYVCTHVWRERD